MSNYRLRKELNIGFYRNTAPTDPEHKRWCWEVMCHDWDCVSLGSKFWASYSVRATCEWLQHYDRIVAIGVGSGYAFAGTDTHVHGVDISQDIHHVARANCKIRGTKYTQITLDVLEHTEFDAAFIDCGTRTDQVLDYLCTHHHGPILAAHKIPSELHKLVFVDRTIRDISNPNRANDPGERVFTQGGYTVPRSLQIIQKSPYLVEISPRFTRHK